MDRLEFQPSKKSKLQSRRLSVFTSVLSLVLIFFGVKNPSNITIIIGICFLALGVYLLVKSYSTSATVILNEHGLTSRVNAMGLIEWKFIDGFELKNALNTSVIMVRINEPTKLLHGINRVSKKLMESNIHRLGSPVVIPADEFDESLDLVLEKMEQFRRNLNK